MLSWSKLAVHCLLWPGWRSTAERSVNFQKKRAIRVDAVKQLKASKRDSCWSENEIKRRVVQSTKQDMVLRERKMKNKHNNKKAARMRQAGWFPKRGGITLLWEGDSPTYASTLLLLSISIPSAPPQNRLSKKKAQNKGKTKRTKKKKEGYDAKKERKKEGVREVVTRHCADHGSSADARIQKKRRSNVEECC